MASIQEDKKCPQCDGEMYYDFVKCFYVCESCGYTYLSNTFYLSSIFLTLFLTLFLGMPFLKACDSNNEFTEGENIDLCLKNCTYPHISITTQIACDGNVTVFLTAWDNNGDAIATNIPTTRNVSSYNASIGIQSFTGEMLAEFCGYSYKGEKCEKFVYKINSIVDDGVGAEPLFVQKDELEASVMQIIKKNATEIAENLKDVGTKYWAVLMIGLLFFFGWKAQKRRERDKSVINEANLNG